MRWSPTGWGAEYINAEGDRYTRSVERWGDRGEALVGSEEEGRLVPATKLPRFQQLVEFHRVVSVVPAAPGWTLHAQAFAGAPAFTTPIAAWVMDGDGDFWPVAGVGEPSFPGMGNPDPEGEHSLRATLDTRHRIVPPSQP
jgi:hypothetical protein